MSALPIIGLLLVGILVVWLYTRDWVPAQLYKDKLNNFVKRVPEPKPPAASPGALFSVQGRDRAATPTTGRRAPGGLDLRPLHIGDGRIRTANAPCWNCGEPKTTNHNCPS